MSRKHLMSAWLPLCCIAVLSGCGIGPIDHSTSGTLTLQGMVHGGQQPVSGATIELFTVGSAGNGSAATPMLTVAGISDATGHFNITGDYTCGNSNTGAAINSPSNQVYIVAAGGNPGLGIGKTNPALVMMAALGGCAGVPAMKFIEINEVTSVAAAWALAPFAASSQDIGASSTNSAGIENAFLNAALLADVSVGLPRTNLPSNLKVETAKIYALANAMASCINSDGTTGCNNFFTAATPNGGTAPTHTFEALLNIVRRPGRNVNAVFQSAGSTPPFPALLSESPNDWTMSLTVTGGGLSIPTDLAIDQDSNVWVSGQPSPLSVFSPQGTPLSTTGFGVNTIAQVFSVAVDSVGDIWVTNQNGEGGHNAGSTTEFYGSNASPANFGSIIGDYRTGLSVPYALSADTNGNMFIANNGSASATVYGSNGTLVYSNLGEDSDLNAEPIAIAVDSTHGFWLSGDNQAVAHFAAPSTNYPNGQLLSYPSCCSESYGVAVDSDGIAWVADYAGGSASTGAFAELDPSKSQPVISGSSVGGLYGPALVVIDAAQNVWMANYSGNTISEIAGNHASVTGGTALSPTTGVYGTGGYGLDASLNAPLGIGVDSSGNVWVTDEGTNSITMFYGIATPTATPVQPVPTAP